MQRREGKNKIQEKQVMHRTIALHSLTSALPIPVGILAMTLNGMEYPFGYFRSSVLGMLLLGFLCSCCLAEYGNLNNPQLSVSTP